MKITGDCHNCNSKLIDGHCPKGCPSKPELRNAYPALAALSEAMNQQEERN